MYLYFYTVLIVYNWFLFKKISNGGEGGGVNLDKSFPSISKKSLG